MVVEPRNARASAKPVRSCLTRVSVLLLCAWSSVTRWAEGVRKIKLCATAKHFEILEFMYVEVQDGRERLEPWLVHG